MNEWKSWSYAPKAREDAQLSRFLYLATWVSNILGLLGIISGLSALVTLAIGMAAGAHSVWWGILIAVIGQLVGAVLFFLLGAFVSAGAEVLARCVVSVERPGSSSGESA